MFSSEAEALSIIDEVNAWLEISKWTSGDLSWMLHEGQLLLKKDYDSSRGKGKLFVGNCSRQFGKSFWAAALCVETALSKPKAQIRYGAAFQSDLVDYIIPTFEKVLEECPEAFRPRWSSIASSFIFPNGSKIRLVGVDKHPNALRGNTLDLVILDECGFITNLDYIFKSVLLPATTHRPNAKIVMISTPPSTPAHAFADFVHRAMSEGCYGEYDVYQNPMLNEAMIAELMKEVGGEGTTTWKREYLCQLITDADLSIIPEWNDGLIQDIPRDEFFKYYHTYVGLDLGVKDFTAGLLAYYDFKRASVIIEDEFHAHGPQMTTETLATLIKEKEKSLWGEKPVFRRISDNNWPLLITDLGSLHNIHFMTTDKDTLEAMINEVRIMVRSGQVLVHPRCSFLIGCLKYGVWDSKKKAFARSSVYGHFDHLAALIYLVRNLAKHSNPIPIDHGFENHKAWLGNIKEQRSSTHNARTLNNALIPKRPGVVPTKFK